MGRRMDALIFDCDGTLADTMPMHYVSWLETLAPYGVAFPEDRFWALGGWTAEAIVTALAREQGGLTPGAESRMTRELRAALRTLPGP